MNTHKLILILTVILSHSLYAQTGKASVTKFNDIAPVTIYKNEYIRKNIIGLKNYKVPLYNDLRYSVFTSLMGVTIVTFPKNMRVKSHTAGMEDYFDITPKNTDLKKSDDRYRYLFIRPVIPSSIPASINMQIQRNKNLLNKTSTQLHVILEDEDGEDVFMKLFLEITGKRYENESIEIFVPEIEVSDESVLKDRLIALKKENVKGMEREKLLNFGDFRLFEFKETKTYNDTTKVTLHTVTATKGYYYFHLTIEGDGLFPLKNDDIKLETNYYSKGLFWEVTKGWHTHDVESITVYPNEQSENMPLQDLNYVPESPFRHQVTFRFKSTESNNFFYSKLNLKNGSIYFEKKIFLKKATDQYYPFLNEKDIWQ